jgi:hypothetical protein
MTIKVECYAGYRVGERKLEVSEIVDRWMGPTERYFRCRTEDGSLYVLRHDESSGEWDLAAFTHSKRTG